MKKQLNKGDLLIVKSIDRLGRNYNDIIKEWREITQEIGADIKVIDMELLDTRGKGKDLTGAFISDLVLQILAYVAETERTFIRERQAEGIALAKAKGVKFGREKKKLPKNYREVCKMISDGSITIDKGIHILGISKSTYYRRICKSKKRFVS